MTNTALPSAPAAPEGASWRQKKWILGGLLAVLWTVFAVDALVFQHKLLNFGIVPRDVYGLPGIAFAPLLHGNLGHILNNSVGLVLLGYLILRRRLRDFVVVSALGVVVGGLGTWVIGRSAVHVGYSGVIFAYLGYLLGYGLFARNLWNILVSVVFGLLFGGMLAGMLPTDSHISWEGHIFGFLAGVLAAKLLAPRALARR
jgi:membrane associated rhomboid family serine protease